MELTMGNRLTQIATRTGDNGTTGLGDNTRVSKDSLRVHAMGDVDELNSHIGASQAHVCRTVARRAERAVVALGAQDTLKDTPRQYLNRLSDLMFVLSRVLNRYRTDGTVGDDVYWKSERMAKAATE
jgi:cob(I)alamin adenosyltransferase